MKITSSGCNSSSKKCTSEHLYSFPTSEWEDEGVMCCIKDALRLAYIHALQRIFPQKNTTVEEDISLYCKSRVATEGSQFHNHITTT